MTVDVPLFVPTAAGPMSAMASVPDSGRLRTPTVALLPGHEAERVRIDALRDIAHALAGQGHPVVSFDYPGIGMSPSKALPRDEVPATIAEACEWFMKQSGLAELALVGTCGGAALALRMGAQNPSVTKVVAQGLPLHLRQGRSKSRVRAGIAALDWVGPRLAKSLTSGSNSKYSQTEWNQQLVEDMCAAAARVRVHLVFSRRDRPHKDFLELKESQIIPPETADRLEITVAPGGLALVTNLEHQAWFSELVQRSLAASAVESGAVER